MGESVWSHALSTIWGSLHIVISHHSQKETRTQRVSFLHSKDASENRELAPQQHRFDSALIRCDMIQWLKMALLHAAWFLSKMG